MIKKFWVLIRKTYSEWKEDKAPRLAAALAYYSGFSLAPILVIAIAVASIFYDRQVVHELVIDQITALAGKQGGVLINTMLEASRDFGTNLLLAGLGIVALIFGATGVFLQLQDALNTMWEVAPKPNQGIFKVIKDRFFSFTMVITVGFLLLVSLVISTALAALENWGYGFLPGLETVVQILNFIISLLVITVIFALLFKYVPDAQVQWKDVWLGAAVTALLLTVGKSLIGYYLGNTDMMAQFGGAGALVVILLWVYYSAQISFLGAEFTQVYANTFGSRVVPAENAVSLTEEARLEQGIPRQEQMAEENKLENPAVPVFARDIENPRSDREGKASIHAPGKVNNYRVIRALAVSFIITTIGSLASGFLLGNSRRAR